MHLIVRPPSHAFRRALSTHPEGTRIDPWRAAHQHRSFTEALAAAGADLIALPPEPELPDAPFVSDALVALPAAGESDGPTAALVVARPGASSRRPEVVSVELAARSLLASKTPVVRIEAPGTLDGGDVIVFGHRVAVGVSARTNRNGAEQLAAVARSVGYSAFLCPVTDRLHLASQVTVTGPGELVGTDAGFASLDAAGPNVAPQDAVERLLVPDEEVAGANVLAASERLFIAAGNPRTVEMLRASAHTVVELELDEFTRADGGPTCLVAMVP
jgi:dimethylargininase